MFLNIFRIGTAIESEISIIIREITFREGDRLVACGKGDGGWLGRGGGLENGCYIDNCDPATCPSNFDLENIQNHSFTLLVCI